MNPAAKASPAPLAAMVSDWGIVTNPVAMRRPSRRAAARKMHHHRAQRAVGENDSDGLGHGLDVRLAVTRRLAFGKRADFAVVHDEKDEMRKARTDDPDKPLFLYAGQFGNGQGRASTVKVGGSGVLVLLVARYRIRRRHRYQPAGSGGFRSFEHFGHFMMTGWDGFDIRGWFFDHRGVWFSTGSTGQQEGRLRRLNKLWYPDRQTQGKYDAIL